MTLAEARSRWPEAETFTFGDSRELCDNLLDLVRQGKKTATCGALRDFENDGEALPMPGRPDIVLDWDGVPALVIETLSVEILRFDEVSAEFAMAEGESADYVGWRDGHIAFFERNGGWSPDMMLVCERFRLVEDLA